jgi:hypothetical protein
MSSNVTESDEDSPVKKAYHSPKLLVYGNIREITQALNGTMGNDNAGGNSHKTT